jgi:4-hydroxybenzoate polyprenyltransferase
VTHEGNKLAMGALFGMLKNYAILAVMITLIREIIKDAEDVQGDDVEGMQTLPIVLGMSKTNSIIAVLAFISSGAIVYYCFTHLLDNNLFYLMGYLGLFVIAPLIFIAIRVLQAKSKEDYTQLSKWVKIITVMGIFALAVLTFNLKQNVA